MGLNKLVNIGSYDIIKAENGYLLKSPNSKIWTLEWELIKICQK